MWTYYQSTGRLEHDGKLIGFGYSGRGEGKNNPEMQSVKNTGPIPQGAYLIGAFFTHPTKGMYVARLTPYPSNEMFGRSGFLLHGDSIRHPGWASEGCPILNRPERILVMQSKDTMWKVVA